MTFGDKLKQARLAIGLTQKQVSERAGMSERQYQSYENNRRTPNVLIAAKLASSLECTLDSLVLGCTPSNVGA